jgi:DNA polymerase-3 subunit delta'
MSFAAIEGQDAALRVLTHAMSSDRLGQSYLFVGPSGVGKQLAAMALARAMLCPVTPDEGCDACEVCARVSSGNHPDVRVWKPRDEGNRNLPVEYLRSEVLPLARFAPFEGPHAFFIFPEADVSFPVQHPEAANALLKTLEEPRPTVHFLLLSERPDRLLSTIRSRCQRLRFAPLAPSVLDRVLQRHNVPVELRSPALALAGGRADVALALCEGDCAQHVLELALRIDQALDHGSPADLLELGESLARADDRGLVLECLATFYRDVAAAGLGRPDTELSFAHHFDAIQARARLLRPCSAAQRVARIARVGREFERNANAEVALDGLFFGLRAAG